MAMKVKWAEVVMGEVTTKHTVRDNNVEEITVDQQTLGLVVQLGNGSVVIYSHECPYKLCMADVAEIITPKIEIAS